MIQDVDLPQGCYISAIVRDERVMMAHHDQVVESGDHLIVFVARRRQVRKVEQLFEVKLGFF